LSLWSGPGEAPMSQPQPERRVGGGCVASRTAKVSGQWVLPTATEMNCGRTCPSASPRRTRCWRPH
jgi:hypothetical protein